MSKRFLITENERNSILSLYAKKGIILEQVTDKIKSTPLPKTMNDWQVSQNLQKDINKIILGDKANDIKGIEDDIFGQLSLTFVSGGSGPTEFKFLLNGENTGSVLKIPQNGVLRFNREIIVDNNVSIQKYLTPIYNNPDYKILFEKYPSLKKHIESFTIPGYLVPGANSDTMNITLDLTNMKDPLCKSGPLFKLEDEIPLGKILTVDQRSGFSLDIGKRNCARFEIGYASFILGEFYIPNPILPEKTSDGGGGGDDTVSIEIILKMENPFQFNKTILYPDGVTELKKFVDDIKEVKNTYGETVYNDYINFLNSKKIEVLTSSSIDDDPSQTIKYTQGEGGNAVDDCGGTQTRHEYNFCLSKQRAIAIINQLKTDLPELSGTTTSGPAFIPKPIGETSQFDEANTWPKVTGKDDKEKAAKTAKNRVVLITLPSFKKDYDN